MDVALCATRVRCPERPIALRINNKVAVVLQNGSVDTVEACESFIAVKSSVKVQLVALLRRSHSWLLHRANFLSHTALALYLRLW